MSSHRYTGTPSPHAEIPKAQRMYLHILEANLDRGLSLEAATEQAARTVNKHRADRAHSGKAPKLVTEGGSSRQWYPGKFGAAERYICLSHNLELPDRAALVRHYQTRHPR